MTPSGVSIVIPLFNAPASPIMMNRRLIPVLANLTCPWRILYVDDGSINFEPLQTALNRVSKEEEHTGWISLKQNGGQQKAVFAGLREVTESFGKGPNHCIITMDDDLAHPPEQILPLLHRVMEGYDLVYAVPENRTGGGLLVRGGRFLRDLFFRKAMGAPRQLKIGSFRVFRGDLAGKIVADGINHTENCEYTQTVYPPKKIAVSSFVYISAMAFRRTGNVSHITYPPAPGLENPKLSRYTVSRRILLLIRLILYYGPVTGKLLNRSRKSTAGIQEIRATGGWAKRENRIQ